MRKSAIFFAAAFLASPLGAKDSLGVFSQWGAFRDADVPRCYAISAAQPDRNGKASAGYVSVGNWPRQSIRGQIHFRLSQETPSKQVRVRIGRQTFSLDVSGRNAWAKDRKTDAAIIAALRSSDTMSLGMRDKRGKRVSDSYALEGAATAIDAATVACSRMK